MKIRINDDSIRLRLDRNEVADIGAGKSVNCRTRFAGGAEFQYALSVGVGEAVSAEFSGGRIEVIVPVAIATDWAIDEAAVSIHGENEVADSVLALLIEKDFECLDPREGEDQSNRFVNPKAAG